MSSSCIAISSFGTSSASTCKRIHRLWIDNMWRVRLLVSILEEQREELSVAWISPATWLYFAHEIAVSIFHSLQCRVVAETHQLLGWHNTRPAFLFRETWFTYWMWHYSTACSAHTKHYSPLQGWGTHCTPSLQGTRHRSQKAYIPECVQ